MAVLERAEHAVNTLRNAGWVVSPEHQGTVLTRKIPHRVRAEMQSADKAQHTVNWSGIFETVKSKAKSLAPWEDAVTEGIEVSEPIERLVLLASAKDTPPQSEEALKAWNRLIAYIEFLTSRGIPVELHRIALDLDDDPAVQDQREKRVRGSRSK